MKNKKTVAQFLEDKARSGQYFFILDELILELGYKKKSVAVSLSRLAKHRKVQMIRDGFGIITSHSNGPLDPSYFLNGMMNYLRARYYVGLLNAASYWGASHQAVMTYTVVSNKFFKPVKLKGLTIDFIVKNHFEDIDEIKKVAGLGGYYNVSTPELTAIDLIRFPKKSGYWNNIATVLSELSEKIKHEKIENICKKNSTPTTTLQRLGYIFDKILGEKKLANCIYKILRERKMQIIPLSLASSAETSYSVDKKWNLKINTHVEVD